MLVLRDLRLAKGEADYRQRPMAEKAKSRLGDTETDRGRDLDTEAKQRKPLYKHTVAADFND